MRSNIRSKTERKFLKLLLQKALEHPKEPYMGYRELCRAAGTSTRTLQKYLPYLLEHRLVRVVEIGKCNKYAITEAGEQRSKTLERTIAHLTEIDRLLTSREPRLLVSEFPQQDFIGSSTVYYEPGDSFSIDGKAYVDKQVKQLLTRLHEEYPRLEFHGLFSSVPRRRAGSDPDR